jgi:hypothetical protein
VGRSRCLVGRYTGRAEGLRCALEISAIMNVDDIVPGCMESFRAVEHDMTICTVLQHKRYKRLYSELSNEVPFFTYLC